MPFSISIPAIIAVILVVLAIVVIVTSYVKAPPDTAYIISGLQKEPRVLVGRAGIKLPFLERLDKLTLKQITIDVKTEDFIPTKDFINVMVDSVVKVQISTDPEMIKLAMRNFLNKSSKDIVQDLQDSLQGNMKEMIGAMDLKAISNDRDSFGNQVSTKAQADMQKLGVNIISCNIQNVTDKNGLIDNLGMDNTSKIQKDAAIAKAEADRDVEIAKAKAEKEANEARVQAETIIAEKNNQLMIKKAELKKESDTQQAVADAAYKIQEQQQRSGIEKATVNADIARQEREVELKAREVEVTEKALEAEVKKKAEAEKYAALQQADADLYRRQKDAEAKKYEAEREADARKAAAEAALVAMQNEAEGIRAKGKAEAEAIQAKALAEAEGMEKKAEAYQKYNTAAMAEMLIKVLPDIAGKIAEPLTQIDKITIIGGGEANGVDSIAGNVPAIMAKLFASMKETTGIDLGEIVKAGTYDAKVNRNIHVDGLPGIAGTTQDGTSKDMADEAKEDVSVLDANGDCRNM